MSIAPTQPFMVQCPFCMAVVRTKTQAVPGTATWLTCLGLVVVGCFYGCCLIPFCLEGLQDVEHICPHCQRTIALRKRI